MKKEEILQHFKVRGIPVPSNPKTTNKELERILGIDYYNKYPKVQTWGMYKRLFELHTPQLCFSFKELKPEEQKNILTSEDWLGEVKIDGLRCIITYHPDWGFEFFSRDISDITFLPNCYTEKILLITKDGRVRTPQSYRGMFKQSFILDAEVLVSNKTLDTTSRGGTFSATELNATVSILGSHAERAVEIQMDGNPLKFCVFDMLEFDNQDLKIKTLRQRRQLLTSFMKKIDGITPFELPESTIINKQEFFDRIVANGGEGLVLKNLNEQYYATTSRKRHVQVKMKRTLTGSKNEDIDCFISGSIFPKKNSALAVQNLIGGIKVSCYVEEEDELLTEQWIGTISGITDSLRRKMTILDNDGNPTLNPEYLGLVLACEGQDFSSKNNRMSHCRAMDWNFRVDKKPNDCIISREFIESMIL